MPPTVCGGCSASHALADNRVVAIRRPARGDTSTMCARCSVGSRWLVSAVLIVLLAGCSGDAGDGGPPVVDAEPFAGLQQCGDAPYVGLFAGLTDEGLMKERNGSKPSWDVYGVRPDGSVVRVTMDLLSYDFAISADGLTVFASPEPDQIGPRAGDTATPDQLIAIDAMTGEQNVLIATAYIGSLAVSPDGSQVAVTVPTELDSTLYFSARLTLLALDESGELTRLPDFDPELRQVDRNPVWSPGGQSLAYIAALPDHSNEVRVLDVETGEERVVYRHPGQDGYLASLAWSPDGRRLLTNEINNSAIEIDAEGGTAAIVLDGVRGDLAYSALDGSQITAIPEVEIGSPLLAQTWTRGPDGVFQLTSSHRIGTDVGLVTGNSLVIADCALG